MLIEYMGWDIGGAHLKAVAMAGGVVVSVAQKPCPLWLGLDYFHTAIRAILDEWQPPDTCFHAVTMTGELADVFNNRVEGVFGLINALAEHVPSENVIIFAGFNGFLPAGQVQVKDVPSIASANWLATGLYAASKLDLGLLVDIGSTTTDFLVLRHGRVMLQGYTDFERLCHGELAYCGVVRTSLMALTKTAPFEGEWIGLMAEHFATTADVYRLTGELSEHADQTPTADGGEKSVIASARRIARLLGLDMDHAQQVAWKQLAAYFREKQLECLMAASMRHLSRGLLNGQSPIIGAGVGRFLVQELAQRLGHPYLDFDDLYPKPLPTSEFHLADCAPALAVACLARQSHA